MSARLDVFTEYADEHVALVEVQRPPNNYLDLRVVRALADTFETLAADRRCRAIVVASQGKHFSAGRDHAAPRDPKDTAEAFFGEAERSLRGRCRGSQPSKVPRSAEGSGWPLQLTSALPALARGSAPALPGWASTTASG